MRTHRTTISLAPQLATLIDTGAIQVPSSESTPMPEPAPAPVQAAQTSARPLARARTVPEWVADTVRELRERVEQAENKVEREHHAELLKLYLMVTGCPPTQTLAPTQPVPQRPQLSGGNPVQRRIEAYRVSSHRRRARETANEFFGQSDAIRRTLPQFETLIGQIERDLECARGTQNAGALLRELELVRSAYFDAKRQVRELRKLAYDQLNKANEATEKVEPPAEPVPGETFRAQLEAESRDAAKKREEATKARRAAERAAREARVNERMRKPTAPTPTEKTQDEIIAIERERRLELARRARAQARDQLVNDFGAPLEFAEIAALDIRVDVTIEPKVDRLGTTKWAVHDGDRIIATCATREQARQIARTLKVA